ncbi:MAG: lipoyl(octanoyl) transferase LipB [Deltaproteobacteria bacterium]|nr:lipoyl(octanoyl) transferase LipB [Deltaproteobacteria bacterium]
MKSDVNESEGCLRGFCAVYHLGTVDYTTAYSLQQNLQEARIDGLIDDTILLLDHNPVITLGKSGNKNNVLVSQEYLKTQQGIDVLRTDRGGDVTFHNIGQIVAYFIVNIEDLGISVYQYVRSLEEIVIKTLEDFGITGDRDAQHPGVWVGNKKICAIGLNVTRGVSMHGFALNANNDLSITSYINPCGLHDRGVTSLRECLSQAVDMKTVVTSLLHKMDLILDVDIAFHEAGAQDPDFLKVF